MDLLRLPMLNGLRARSLYKQGITCVADLAIASELNVERALYNALPFERYANYFVYKFISYFLYKFKLYIYRRES